MRSINPTTMIIPIIRVNSQSPKNNLSFFSSIVRSFSGANDPIARVGKINPKALPIGLAKEAIVVAIGLYFIKFKTKLTSLTPNQLLEI